MKPLYGRVLLKISGEAMRGENGKSENLYNKGFVESLCDQIIELQDSGVELAIVVGGGNIFRGAQHGIANDPTTDHFIGMTATMINGVIFQELLRKKGRKATCLSAIECNELCETYTPAKGRKYLERGHILILAGGSGNPFCSTDFAGVLRAIELGAEIMWKATKVDGVFTKDPKKYNDAKRLPTVSYDKALADHLNIMDQPSFALAREHSLPIQIFNVFIPKNLLHAATNKELGSLVSD